MADERQLNIDIILVDEKANRKEILSFQCYIGDIISVKRLMDKIPQYARDTILRTKSYDCLCLENNFILDDLELLQSYLLPSKERQFLIAVPTGKSSAQSAKLALPIINEVTSQATIRREISSMSMKYDVLRQLQASRRCSMMSDDTTDDMEENTEIRIPDFVCMIFALIVIYFTH